MTPEAGKGPSYQEMAKKNSIKTNFHAIQPKLDSHLGAQSMSYPIYLINYRFLKATKIKQPTIKLMPSLEQ